MSIGDVKNTFARITKDGRIDSKDIDELLKSAGSIDKTEEAEIKKSVDSFGSKVDADAKAKLREKLGEISYLRKEAASINKSVKSSAPKLAKEAADKLKVGVATKSYGGSPVPEAVKKYVNEAIKKGATSYDVREMKKDPVYDTEHGDPELTLDGKFNPYGQDQRAEDSMTFEYTELTPAKFGADTNTTQTWKELDGYNGSGQGASAKFKTVTGKPAGNITALYDEATWSETKARGPGGQKYANNFAILADGSMHCVPASRRSKADPGRILTTASLARGKPMLFNGHIEMRDGVVTYIGMSGRLCKLQAKGEAKFVDPVEIIKAWGFKTAPGLTVTKEG